LPLRTVLRAFRDIFVIAPPGLDERVQTIMSYLTTKYAFNSYKTYVARAGRVQFIEINIEVSADFAIQRIEKLDQIRQEIADSLEHDYRDNWLTISFTADKKWL
ncbi:MAG TPA: cation efflux family transporter, partial [Gammaproteobacteria bacterium]|nr:cation efflux family transporter [Gammaproteobacteria bacterium]